MSDFKSSAFCYLLWEDCLLCDVTLVRSDTLEWVSLMIDFVSKFGLAGGLLFEGTGGFVTIAGYSRFGWGF